LDAVVASRVFVRAMNLDRFRNTKQGEDVYVLGSGKTLDFYPKSFFDDKTLIGVNHGWRWVVDFVDFMVTKYHHLALRSLDFDNVGTVVVTRGLRGHHDLEQLDDDRLCVVEHNHNTVEKWAGEWPENGLVASHSSITTAMHLAAVLGAKNIIMLGADCGVLDEETNLTGYANNVQHGVSNQASLFSSFDRQNRICANIIREKYGANVVSMLPFVTPNMEGHSFRSHAGGFNVT